MCLVTPCQSQQLMEPCGKNAPHIQGKRVKIAPAQLYYICYDCRDKKEMLKSKVSILKIIFRSVHIASDHFLCMYVWFCSGQFWKSVPGANFAP